MGMMEGEVDSKRAEVSAAGDVVFLVRQLECRYSPRVFVEVV